MVIKVGDKAPPFSKVAHDGSSVSLAALKGKKNLVLYFYPRDFTAVCTRETCGFRDLLAGLGREDVLIVGVSTDNEDTHKQFAVKYKVNFPLLADTDKELAKAYGVFGGLRSLFGVSSRVTFVIDKQGEIRERVDSEWSASEHIKRVQRCLDSLPSEIGTS